MAENRIQQALSQLFKDHRVVFWYDEKREFRDVFETLQIDAVEKIEIDNNEFTLKHRILCEEPKQLFLVYRESNRPEDPQNWLLDIELDNVVFTADQSAIWLSELGLPQQFSELTMQHAAFFGGAKAAKQADQRKANLLGLLVPEEDTLTVVRLKMLAVCAGKSQRADARIDVICEKLLSELVLSKEPVYKLIQRCGLELFLWDQIDRYYGYASKPSSVEDFSMELFKSCYAMSIGKPRSNDKVALKNDALVFFKRWKESRIHQDVFKTLSDKYADLLNIEEDLNDRDLNDVIEIDYYQLIDEKVIFELVAAVNQRTLSADKIEALCRQRQESHWYLKYKHLYDAIKFASRFLELLETFQLSMAQPVKAVHGYVRHWFRLDQFYRRFIYALKMSGEATLLSSLVEEIENSYTNKFLMPLSTAWQAQVDQMSTWQITDVVPQCHFYSRWVRPYVDKGIKICVIISDAFRYELGDEMVGRIRQEDRYQATIDHMLSALPSYTQLGMASLLPNVDERLSIAGKTGTVFVDNQSSQGTSNRDKILKSEIGDRAGAIQAKDLMDMTREGSRELLKDNDVLYVYHNRIDHTGDKMQSEGEVFEAAEKTFSDLMRLLKKLNNANAYNFLITADHGFVYQNRSLEESDFLASEPSGEIFYRDRRFLLGIGLGCDNSMKKFTAEGLGLMGDVGAVIPKGIQRLRLSGSGSRFIHGGAMLQEVIVPVIAVSKKRQSDVELVEVDILRSGTSVITAGQLSVTLYQREAVSDKRRPRKLQIGIYTASEQLISDVHSVTMGLTADNARERELKLQFILMQEADSVNNQEVSLKLKEPVDGTNQFKEYKQLKYTVRRSFTSDFDFNER